MTRSPGHTAQDTCSVTVILTFSVTLRRIG